jgi:hypothetical protein
MVINDKNFHQVLFYFGSLSEPDCFLAHFRCNCSFAGFKITKPAYAGLASGQWGLIIRRESSS